MQTHHLEAFLVLAEELSFRRAAGRLSISQPGLSDQIRQLERQLGMQLFTRDRSGTALTPAGRRLLPLASRAVAAITALTDLDNRNAQHPYPTGIAVVPLRVGILGDGVGEMTWSILSQFRQARPEVPIELRALSFAQAHNAVRDDLADAVFLIGPTSPSKYHRSFTVGHEAVGVLASRRSHWDIADLANLATVAAAITYCPPSSIDPHFRRFWSLAEMRERIGRTAPLRTPPDGPSLTALVEQAGHDGVVTLWPARLPVPETAGCDVQLLQEALSAPCQVLVRHEGNHVTALTRILTAYSHSQPESRP